MAAIQIIIFNLKIYSVLLAKSNYADAFMFYDRRAFADRVAQKACALRAQTEIFARKIILAGNFVYQISEDRKK